MDIKKELEDYVRGKYKHVAISIDNVCFYEKDIEKSTIEVTICLDLYVDNYANFVITGKGLFSEDSFIDFAKLTIDDAIKKQIENYFYKVEEQK